MSSIKDRQRAAARARLEKEMAERATAAKNRRRRQAIIGSALAVVVIAGVAVLLVNHLKKDDKKPTAGASALPAGTVACTWTPAGATGGKVKEVGTPPTAVPNTGTSTLTLDTNLGPIEATIDLSKAPCTGASYKFLASKNFLDNTKCHRLVNQDGFKVLQCGDPFATGKGYRETDGQGGPGYMMAEENLPTDTNNPYPAGSIAMAKTQQPGTTGSQFFICADNTQLPPQYTLLGKITKGLDLVQSVVKAGDDGAFAQSAGGGHPKKELDIKTMTVS
ncbi:peptidyl-prolyl cis-trans isomerase [Actinoplanes sp. SE50]|uniref:peptidylprolyl isomerase n=1 Tax=unclassified Actinoplanes TaxID=2626549 RepID=UPI00023EBC46|nr:MULTISPECIES: peptidylprolyl isomerase [unclassified Actinoplanes]AEV87409.1 peptidyl-prolyl cis-trans isomerase B (cyclophilin B) [Actinoplanes sp. SE50/110]ATO85811.1 peptidyl-prolyl cis-trans isomerase [Actinoplanes sp. SE50]SLM03224.1 peptidyl-prolyl cis-trans isomerase [Actinoplanes sp. SE50/110]